MSECIFPLPELALEKYTNELLERQQVLLRHETILGIEVGRKAHSGYYANNEIKLVWNICKTQTVMSDRNL